MGKTDKVQQVLERVGDLPAMPTVVSEVLRLTDDPSVTMAEVGQAIEKDPVLAARILKLSNSPYYGMRQFVGTLKLALVVLGVREVRNIILGVSVIQSLCDDPSEAGLPKEFWVHCVVAAALSRMLGAHLKLGLQGEAFVSGLLHDIGKLILIRKLGVPYVEVYRQSGGISDPLCEAELRYLGFTHADAAAALASRWNFPATLTDAISMHHANDDVRLHLAKDPQLAAVIRLANLAAHHEFRDGGQEELAACNGYQEAWQQLESVREPVEPPARYEVLNTLQENIEQSPLPIF